MTKTYNETTECMVDCVTILPGRTEKVCIGIFESTIPQAKFWVEHLTPNASVKATLRRVDERGDYQLIYELKNNGKDTCEVLVKSDDTFLAAPTQFAMC